eukprot:gnl/Hemi2/3157_TR1114_c0_g9_i1.p1 gnl/Hemi2/3157_TR1114_c0_g9~~gnl/Hemi2/3157_TR1114_c0_g9_i1.p1  ORF type:complete len:442 (+),score=111.58 gnl/Hemi2/3157_TR1114_c0_g9_i1:67-1392(+)
MLASLIPVTGPDPKKVVGALSRDALENEDTHAPTPLAADDAIYTATDGSVKMIPSSQTLEESIAELVTEHPQEAFYMVDLGILARQYHRWTKNLPRVEPWYAVKCNPDPVIVRTLALLGAGFDCASQGELDLVLGLGITPRNRIIFANPCKIASHLRFASQNDVRLMTFDNDDELKKIARTHPNARAVMRILTDDSKSACRFGAKFGAPPADHERLLRLAIELGVECVGVSFHVGSGCMSPDAFVDALHRSRRVFDMAESLGLVFEILDLGGGFLGTFEKSEACFETVAAALSPVLDELFPASSGVRVIAEPGRYMVSETSTLVTRVTSRRVCSDPPADAPERLIYQNDGVYGSFNCMFFDHYNPIPIPLRQPREDEPLLRTTIFGPTCDSLDCIVKSHPMIHLEEGDTLYYQSMGAYTRSAGSCFNGMPLPSLIYVHTSS